MSHFFAVVLVEPKAKIEARVAELMAPYDENLSVEPYNRKCGCVGNKAYRESDKEADKREGTFDSLRASFNAKHGETQMKNNRILYSNVGTYPQEVVDKAEATQKRLEKLWEEHIQKRVTCQEELLAAHPLKDTPNKFCEDCDGTGIDTTTYNPKSQWDYYTIGGRWDGDISGDGVDSDEELRKREEETRSCKVSPLKRNSLLVKDINLKKFSCYAIITPDGKWHGKGRMGWFGISSDEVDNWDEILKDILKKYSDHIAVGIDCHI